MKPVMIEKIMLFGSFDGIHPGHEYLINRARDISPNIILIIAHDQVIIDIKKQNPIYNLTKRISHLQEKFADITIVAGDTQVGLWSAIKEYRPNTIMVGYDQHGLKRALESIKDKYGFIIIKADPYHPEKYKSSLLRKSLK